PCAPRTVAGAAAPRSPARRGCPNDSACRHVPRLFPMQNVRIRCRVPVAGTVTPSAAFGNGWYRWEADMAERIDEGASRQSVDELSRQIAQLREDLSQLGATLAQVAQDQVEEFRDSA